MSLPDPPRTIGSVERLDARLDAFLCQDVSIELLAGGFTWSEGPVWVSPHANVDGCDDPEGCVLFSDIPRNSIFRWSPTKARLANGDQGIDLFMCPSGYTGVGYAGLEPGSNGLTLCPNGRLALCEHGDRRISVLTFGGGKQTVVDSFEGKRLNSPNDLLFDSAGALYFTDPPYGLPHQQDDPRRELDVYGVYRQSPSGDLKLLTSELTRPNGIGLSPDQKVLYVSQSDPDRPIWVAFDLLSGGTLGPMRVLRDASEYLQLHPGLPDGMAVHSSGTLFASGPGGIYVMLPDGTLIGHLVLGKPASNCTFDDDESYLYLTADDCVCRIKLRATSSDRYV